MSGYFGIGVYHPKTETNIGTLWRSAYQLGASFIFTIGRRYKRQASDTVGVWKNIPLHNYKDIDDLKSHLPYDCRLVGIEIEGKSMTRYAHFERAVYLLGAEDYGLTPNIADQCHDLISIESIRTASYNVAMAGTIVMYDRQIVKGDNYA